MPRNPPTASSASAPPAKRLRSLGRALRHSACAALILTGGAGCSGVAVYQPYDTALINYRRTLMLDATVQPPIKEDQAKALLAQMETGLLRSPFIATHISRAQFHERYDAKFQLRDDYTILSDTFSVVGLADREQTARIGKETDMEMLLSVQVFSIPCETCVDGDQISAVGQMLDSRTGQVVWRVTLLDSVNKSPAAVEQGLHALSAGLVELFNNSLRPKWQRERFKNLSPRLANQPRPQVPLPTEQAHGILIQTGVPVRGQVP